MVPVPFIAGRSLKSSMATSRELGEWGEALAAKYMIQKGFSLLEHNYHSRYGEIDLILENGDFVVFAEVKLRKSSRYGTPAEAVTPRKQEKLRLTAMCYLQNHGVEKQPRFDVIELYAPQGKQTPKIFIHHIENAF